MAGDRGDEGVVARARSTSAAPATAAADASSAVFAWPHHGIAPVELWDVVVAGKTLFARRDEPDFFVSLAAAASALRRGEAVRESGERLERRAWETIALVGGGVDEARARAAFAAADVDLELVSADPFFTAVEALAALIAHGEPARTTLGPAPVVVDVGQTAIKAVGRAGRLHRARSVDSGPSTKDAFAEAVASAVRGIDGGFGVSFLMVALPCELRERDGEIALGASTYPTEGDGRALAALVLGRAGIVGTPLALVNDAVLAACGAGRSARSRLVLTVGYGVGAAFVEATT